ncbi:MAG: NTP transferase domain-containing protein [Flavobacteriaceae bacterium]
MAGGKGSRLKTSEEKPLIKLNGKPIITYVLNALKQAKNIDNVIVSVSENTPQTTQLLSQLKISTINTPGKNFVYDMAYAIKKLSLKTVLVIGSDTPLITSEIIDQIIEKYRTSKKAALNVVVPLRTRVQLGLSRAYEFDFNKEKVVPAGINIINGSKIDNEELNEEVLLLEKTEVALNINTLDDLVIAKNLISKRR